MGGVVPLQRGIDQLEISIDRVNDSWLVAKRSMQVVDRWIATALLVQPRSF